MKKDFIYIDKLMKSKKFRDAFKKEYKKLEKEQRDKDDR